MEEGVALRLVGLPPPAPASSHLNTAGAMMINVFVSRCIGDNGGLMRMGYERVDNYYNTPFLATLETLDKILINQSRM
jgi:hypothetical protein